MSSTERSSSNGGASHLSIVGADSSIGRSVDDAAGILTAGRIQRVSSDDIEDVMSAGRTVMSKFKSFLEEPADLELFSFVIDGKTSDERSRDEAYIMDTLTSFLRGIGVENISTEEPKFESTVFEATATTEAGDKLRVLTSFEEHGQTVIYLAHDLGLKDTILAAHDGYSDFAIGMARILGIDLTDGDLGKKLSRAVSSRDHFEVDDHEDPPGDSEIVVSGMATTGIAR